MERTRRAENGLLEVEGAFYLFNRGAITEIELQVMLSNVLAHAPSPSQTASEETLARIKSKIINPDGSVNTTGSKKVSYN